MGEADVEGLVGFFKALSDANRLRILGLLATRDHNVEELASLLGIGAPTVSHHLSKLKALDLVRMRRDDGSHVYSINTAALRGINRSMFAREQMASWVDDVEVEAWER